MFRIVFLILISTSAKAEMLTTLKKALLKSPSGKTLTAYIKRKIGNNLGETSGYVKTTSGVIYSLIDNKLSTERLNTEIRIFNNLSLEPNAEYDMLNSEYRGDFQLKLTF